jgi:hypothetical protein
MVNLCKQTGTYASGTTVTKDAIKRQHQLLHRTLQRHLFCRAASFSLPNRTGIEKGDGAAHHENEWMKNEGSDDRNAC